MFHPHLQKHLQHYGSVLKSHSNALTVEEIATPQRTNTALQKSISKLGY